MSEDKILDELLEWGRRIAEEKTVQRNGKTAPGDKEASPEGKQEGQEQLG